jgi:hypothetical protein
VTGRHAMSEPHLEGGQGAWEPAGHRPRTLWLERPGCWAHLNKSGARHRPHSAVSADRSSVVTLSSRETAEIVTIGIDARKRIHTGVGVDGAGR